MSNDRSSILVTSSEKPDVIAVRHVEPSSSNRQQRLLRLRNDRFPVKSLPIHGFNSRLSGLNPTVEEGQASSSPPPRNQENIAFPKPRSYGKHYHSTSSFGILEEISNSIKSHSLGTRAKENRGPIPIFQDTPQRALLDPSPYTSPSLQDQYSSPTDSPLPFRNINDSLSEMGLREVSGNVRKASASDSPGLGHIKPGRRRPTAPVTRSSSEEYIQRIERELEFAHDSVYSPNSNRSWKDKLKATQAENESLRQELADTRGTFEAEVQRAVQHKTAAEVGLRRKIRMLEEEVTQKDCIIRDLELKGDDNRLDQHTVDKLRATIDRLESEKSLLGKDNETMSKRNEVLTHLLALSPTKTQQTFEFHTPSRASRSNRPRSLLLPRVSSSPTHTHPHRPQSLASSPASAREFSPGRNSPVSSAASESYSRFPIRPDHVRTQSVQQLGATHSRSSTLASCVSMSPTAEHRLSSASSVDQYGRRASSRGPRRYLPGSTQLKPLLLPTLSGEFGALNLTSPVTSPVKGSRRDFTDESVDPSTMFLSKSPVEYESDADNSFNDSSGDATRTASARQLAYQSLEGVLDSQGSNDASIGYCGAADMDNAENMGLAEGGRTVDRVLQSPASTSTGDDPDRTILPAPPRPMESAPNALKDPNAMPDGGLGLPSPARYPKVAIPEPLFTPRTKSKQAGPVNRHSIRPTSHAAQPALPPSVNHSRKRRKFSSSSVLEDSHTSGTETALQAPEAAGAKTPPTGSRPPSWSVLSPRVSRGPLELLQRKNFGIRPIAVVTIKTIYGTLSKCSTMIRDFKQDPLALARRVMANAWRTNWAVLGKLSWWVLGLFLGPSAKKQRSSSFEWDEYDGEAIADRHCRRKSRRLPVQQQPLEHDQDEAQTNRRVRFDAAGKNTKKTETKSSPEKPGWGTSVILWAKFSAAIMLAVGGAVVQGPGEMLRETDTRRASRRSRGLRRVSISSKSSELSESSGIGIEMQDMSPMAAGSKLRRRRPHRQSLCSPPPSARALLSAELDAGVLSSSPPVSSSPLVGSFRFGRGQAFDFDMSDPEGVDADTLKPSKPSRINIEDIFDHSTTGTPIKLPDGEQEYDVESAGLGRFRSIASTPDSLR